MLCHLAGRLLGVVARFRTERDATTRVLRGTDRALTCVARSLLAIGLGAAIDYVTSVGKPRIRAHEAELARYAHERLREINSLRIFGTAKDKGPIVSFELKGAHPHDVATIIDRAGVAVRAGTHCVMPLLARYGVTATCRASFAMYNTREEVDCLAQALLKAQNLLG